MEIELQDETKMLDSTMIDQVKSLLLFCAKEEAVPENVELSVLFVKDAFIQQLNKQYRGIDRATDVLAFPQQENQQWKKQTKASVPLGDLIISVEHAKKQAHEYGHSLIREIGFLSVHGFLHLLGYDHKNEEEEKHMFQKQEEILGEFGLER